MKLKQPSRVYLDNKEKIKTLKLTNLFHTIPQIKLIHVREFMCIKIALFKEKKTKVNLNKKMFNLKSNFFTVNPLLNTPSLNIYVSILTIAEPCFFRLFDYCVFYFI